MNKIVNNLAQIADAAEYFDKKTGAAWKIRSSLTNMIVWACNAHLYALKTDSVERLVSTMVVVSTLRTWVHDSSCNAFVLDLTPAAVRKTLGLERNVDVHVEAVRSARQKCIQTRSATQFKKYYDAAITAFDEQRRTREEAVETIAELISDNEWALSHDVADYLETFLGTKVVGTTISDADLYDDGAVERQSDQLAETLGNALEAMYDVCDVELGAAITAEKINRLTGYHKAITNMMTIVGVDTSKLAMRRAKLEQLIEQQISLAEQSVKDIDAQIAEQLAEPIVEEAAPQKPKRQRIKKADAMKDIGALVAS